MTVEEAKSILLQLIEFMHINFGEQSDDVIEGLDGVIELLNELSDEAESAWMMLEELKESDEALKSKEIDEELRKIFSDRRKIAKVSEA